MQLKTLIQTGKIILKDYTREECRCIFTERNRYVLKCVHSFGTDYGGSHCSEGRETTYEEIIPERILVKNGHFCGAAVIVEFDQYNGGGDNTLKEVCLFADGSAAASARDGVSFSNDDHSRWDYTDYYLTLREDANMTQK